jgi:CheY-like chemotaxis protein
MARSVEKVLVVDDDPVALMLLRTTLEDAGFEVIARAQALGTASAIREHKPDVVLLDLNMPALSGDQLAALIQRAEHLSSVPIIFHSAADPDTLREIAARVGALGAIQKSHDPNAFLDQFMRLLEQRPA